MIDTRQAERDDVVAFLRRKAREDDDEEWAVQAEMLADVFELGTHEGEAERARIAQLKAEQDRQRAEEEFLHPSLFPEVDHE